MDKKIQNIFEGYIQSISKKFSYKETSEMGYRTDFEILLKGIFETIKVKRIDHLLLPRLQRLFSYIFKNETIVKSKSVVYF